MPRLVPISWMPECRMVRVITHWTGGGHHATDAELEHYHFLIEGDGNLVRGDHPISANEDTTDDEYAAHTRGLNTGSIGVSLCCMAGAQERPFQPGTAALTQKQYGVLAVVAADLCEAYRIPVKPETVLGHGEVEEILGKPQRGKWDPMVLPWNPGQSRRVVGDAFRQSVQVLLADTRRRDGSAPIRVVIGEREITAEAILLDGTAWCPLAVLARSQGWTILAIDPQKARLSTPVGEQVVLAAIRGGRGYVQIRDLCTKLGWSNRTWDPESRTVTIVP